jgi:regulatory subunit for Cdc7p protein kinase
MKIWAVDKLQRMVDTMFNKETGEDASSYPTRQAVAAQQKGRPADLQRLLQNEKMDRDHVMASQDMIPLRGYYVYVHDMDELTRPVMIREYQKVEKEKGKWPQFRASGNGKCPFVEDPHFGRRQQEEQEARRIARQAVPAPRTRAASAIEASNALMENNNLARRPSAPAVAVKQEEEDAKPLDPPKGLPLKRCNTADGAPPMFGSAQASIRAMPRFIAGEPVASGLHQSNITSAIRSQMISSTAAAPRAGNSKEVNQLKRKVLEKNSVPSANTNSGHSSVTNDVRTALNQENSQPMRAAKRKAQESLGHIHGDDEERQARKAAALRRRKTVEKELKPGYCENCREKFNDFDEHVVSRKHRKFAATAENWAELDQLLTQLDRR